ncbi:hypothetical protein ABZ568_06725 [Streptomyces olindensis]|uniref:Uncharacterized protein n=1 Tax=Streptomyces olindensis TaxID=358823 RepID=A0ABV2XQ29_9ACTN|nr:hypothetical protein DF19_20605 [Streptomyces olindensis]
MRWRSSRWYALAEKGTKHALEFATRLKPRPDGSYPAFALAPDDSLTAAFVPHDAPGVTVVDDWDGIGQRGTVRFHEVHVPADRVVPHHLAFERPEVFGAFGQFIASATSPTRPFEEATGAELKVTPVPYDRLTASTGGGAAS